MLGFIERIEKPELATPAHVHPRMHACTHARTLTARVFSLIHWVFLFVFVVFGSLLSRHLFSHGATQALCSHQRACDRLQKQSMRACQTPASRTTSSQST